MASNNRPEDPLPRGRNSTSYSLSDRLRRIHRGLPGRGEQPRPEVEREGPSREGISAPLPTSRTVGRPRMSSRGISRSAASPTPSPQPQNSNVEGFPEDTAHTVWNSSIPDYLGDELSIPPPEESTGPSREQTSARPQEQVSARSRDQTSVRPREEFSYREYLSSNDLPREDRYERRMMRRSKLPCKFYPKGTCRNGDRCYFLHVDPPVVAPEDNDQGAAAAAVPSLTRPCTLGKDTSLKAIEQSNADWANAPEFVPTGMINKYKSYAEAANPDYDVRDDPDRRSMKLCPHAEVHGKCNNEATCEYIHGDICDVCNMPRLHPFNVAECNKHMQTCYKAHMPELNKTYALARSKDKSCGICFEVIIEKANGEQRFGILPNCNHCFCLSCIRTWRQARQFDNKIIRACPECRITSDFVCPSMYWVDTKEDKEKLIRDYKNALRLKNCKYFKQGRGKCPFGNKCFYMHALPDGSLRDVGPPPRVPRRHIVEEEEADLEVLQQIILWDFLGEREHPWYLNITDELDDVGFLTDSDESDWSDARLFRRSAFS